MCTLAATRSGSAVDAVVGIATIPLEIVIALTSAAVWFGYRHPAALLRSLGRRDFLRSYLGGYVYLAIEACLLLAPVLVLTGVRAYIGPQYEDMAHTVALQLAIPLRAFVAASNRFDGHVGQHPPPPVVFAEQRLIFVEGLRGVLGPDAPAR